MNHSIDEDYPFLYTLVAILLLGVLVLGMLMVLPGCQAPPTSSMPRTQPSPTATLSSPPPGTPPATWLPPAPPSSPSTPPSQDVGSLVLDLVNTERSRSGLRALALDGRLDAAAASYCQMMVRAGQLSHDLGGGFQRRVSTWSVPWQQAGENIAEGYASPQAVMQGWMNSPGHRANIMKPSYTHLGVASLRDGRGVVWWTQEFVQLSNQGLTPAKPAEALHAPGGLIGPDVRSK